MRVGGGRDGKSSAEDGGDVGWVGGDDGVAGGLEEDVRSEGG